ncbi:MAG: hypothetical protein FWG68_04240, partial [Defluviitaleaceae bacterium]|nr:hypothetical protein [Defluviitaleaceae bacterium]
VSIFDIGIGGGNMAIANTSGGIMQDIFGNMRSGAFRDLRTSSGNGEWHVRLGSGNGFVQFSPQLSLENLGNLAISGSANGGVSLELRQGEIIREIEIAPNGANGAVAVGGVDTAGFTAGRVLLRMSFAQAENVDLLVSWDGR